MWKLSIVRGLMDRSEFGQIFDLDIADPTAQAKAVRVGKKLFRKQAKEWTCCHSPKIFFDPEVDVSDWLSSKARGDRAKIASSVADAMI